MNEKALQLHYKLLDAVNNQENKEEKRIFCGTQDFVDFFENIIFAIDLDIDYEVEGVDGELEIEQITVKTVVSIAANLLQIMNKQKW